LEREGDFPECRWILNEWPSRAHQRIHRSTEELGRSVLAKGASRMRGSLGARNTGIDTHVGQQRDGY